MEKLTLEEMNLAYQAVVRTYGSTLDTKHNGLQMYVTIKSKCNPKDNTGIVFDQAKMSIYESGGCCEECRCKSARESLFPVIRSAIQMHRNMEM